MTHFMPHARHGKPKTNAIILTEQHNMNDHFYFFSQKHNITQAVKSKAQEMIHMTATVLIPPQFKTTTTTTMNGETCTDETAIAIASQTLSSDQVLRNNKPITFKNVEASKPLHVASPKSNRSTRVSFAPLVQVIPDHATLHSEKDGTCKDGDNHNCSRTYSSQWYEAEDLGNFREEARTICRQLRLTTRTHSYRADTASLSSSPEEQSQSSLCSMAVNTQTRGLESRMCLERQRRKYLTTKAVVRAQSKLNPERLAALSMRCTRWAALLAREEGARDYIRAYREDECDANLNVTDSNSTLKFKRCLAATTADDIYSERRVRQRASTR